MILTYKIKHGRDFSKELRLAIKIAEYAIKNRSLTSADVKHIGLKSAISNQILRKYSRNKTIKKINSEVKLTIPSQSIRVEDSEIYVACLKLRLPIYFDSNFKKINQIEVGSEYAYVCVSYEDKETYSPQQIIGVDRNSTKHVLVASNIDTGKVMKLGKSCDFVHNKYKNIRSKLQKKKKRKMIKKIKKRESNIIRNINHHISKELVGRANQQKAVLVLEDLKGIRKTAKSRRKQRYILHSWSFHQLQQMIQYKAKKLGVPVAYVEPQYTSKRCSGCGHIGNNSRKGKKFHCTECSMVENADVNAGFNIAYLYQQGMSRFDVERDISKASTDTAQRKCLQKLETLPRTQLL